MEKEKLIIRNFGPIKDVELDIKKVNVLIGEQGTGKSALVRLLNHFTTKNFLFGNDYQSVAEFQDYFFFNDDFEVDYVTPNFQIKYNYEQSLHIKFIGKHKNQLERFSLIYKSFIENFDPKYKDEFYSLSEWFDENIFTNTYIPAERVAVSIIDRIGNNIRIGLDQYLINFFESYGRARAKLSELTIPYLKNVIFRREKLNDTVIVNGDQLLLRATSSGFQSSIPMTVSIEYFTSVKNKIRFIIEEPELNLFPSTQNELMKYLVLKTSEGKNGLFLATHSPYILTSLNNMMYAYQIGQANEQKKSEKVAEIIDKKYWLNPDQVSAYKLLENGTAINILDEELKQIDAGQIDGVSGVINNEWDRIADIEFDNAQ